MRKQESGRSMVEMLGVLAIIGVLSIGGISGYTMAMNRYRANTVLDAATKYAVIVYTGYQTNIAVNSMNGGTNSYTAPSFASTGIAPNSASKIAGATISTPSSNDITDGSVKLTITFDTKKVCEAAASTLGVTCSDNNTISEYAFKQS